MRKQFLLRIPKSLSITLDLNQRLIYITHRCQEWRCTVESVRPHLRCVEHVIENAISATRRFMPYPLQQSVHGILNLRIAGPLSSLCVSLAAHRGIRWAPTDHYTQSSIRRALYDCRLRQQNDLFRSPACNIAWARIPCSQSRRCIAIPAAIASVIRRLLSVSRVASVCSLSSSIAELCTARASASTATTGVAVAATPPQKPAPIHRAPRSECANQHVVSTSRSSSCE